MVEYLLLFATGFVEYLLAATWTRALMSRQVLNTAAITFISAMVWGYVVTQVALGPLLAITIHAAGCALGAAAVCWMSPAETQGPK